MNSLRLDWCSHEAAKYACERWHYSRCLPHSKLIKIGVWENDAFIGCICFGDGANPGMYAPYGLRYEDGCELVRVALRSHATPVSKLVAIALRLLRKRCPGIRLVVSFADPEQGHVGGFYQAGNWVYAGATIASDEYIVHGRRMHGRALRATRSTHRLSTLPASNVEEWARRVIDPNIRKVNGSQKHRYLMPIDDRLKKTIRSLAQPYPKRVESETSDMARFHLAEGGAAPTSTL